MTIKIDTLTVAEKMFLCRIINSPLAGRVGRPYCDERHLDWFEKDYVLDILQKCDRPGTPEKQVKMVKSIRRRI